MFKLIFKVIILIYIILVIFYLLELQKYNTHGLIIESKNINDMVQTIQSLNPTIFKKEHSFKYDPLLTPTLDNEPFNLKEDKVINIFKNKKLIDILNISENIRFDTSILGNSTYLFPIQYSLTIYKGLHQSDLLRCYHNYNILGVLSGETKIYLFNPKHEKDIIHKEKDMVKKWGHKRILQKNDILLIPTNWYYFIETDDDILYHIDINTYFTFLPNILKEYYSTLK